MGEGPLANFSGTFKFLEIKDHDTMHILRGNGDLPLRTRDGGATWQALESVAAIAPSVHALMYSWTGRTLVLFGSGGSQSAAHPHQAYVWKSTDDGDTWTDETGDEQVVTMGASIGQWYEGTVYMNSGGQGIFAKRFE